MTPPLWPPPIRIMTYYLYEKSRYFPANLYRYIAMRPGPQWGTCGARGGLHKIKMMFSTEHNNRNTDRDVYQFSRQHFHAAPTVPSLPLPSLVVR